MLLIISETVPIALVPVTLSVTSTTFSTNSETVVVAVIALNISTTIGTTVPILPVPVMAVGDTVLLITKLTVPWHLCL